MGGFVNQDPVGLLGENNLYQSFINSDAYSVKCFSETIYESRISSLFFDL